MTAVTYPTGGGISYEYDSLGRLTGEMLSIGTKKTYTYNADGVLSEYTNGRNQKTTYTYDSGRITGVSDEAGTIRYTYDGNGNVLTVSETDTAGITGTISRTYDCMNRVTEVTDYKIVSNGKVLSQNSGGKFAFITKEGVAVVSKDGKLITTWSSDYYDSAMQEIITKLFGEQVKN